MNIIPPTPKVNFNTGKTYDTDYLNGSRFRMMEIGVCCYWEQPLANEGSAIIHRNPTLPIGVANPIYIGMSYIVFADVTGYMDFDFTGTAIIPPNWYYNISLYGDAWITSWNEIDL